MKEDMIYEWIKEERIYYSGKYTNIYLTKQYQKNAGIQNAGINNS